MKVAFTIIGEPASNPDVILALDLGTQCGYALRDGDRVVSGSKSFHVKQLQHPGARFAKFRAWLTKMKAERPEISHVVYEVVMGHGPGQVFAAHAFGGFQAVLQEFCYYNSMTFEHFGVSTIKKQFAGSGRAQKCDVIAQCRALGFLPADDNEADAIALLHVATKTAPLLTMSGATPKGKRLPKVMPETAGDPF